MGISPITKQQRPVELAAVVFYADKPRFDPVIKALQLLAIISYLLINLGSFCIIINMLSVKNTINERAVG